MYYVASTCKGDWDIFGISEETEKTAEDLRVLKKNFYSLSL